MSEVMNNTPSQIERISLCGRNVAAAPEDQRGVDPLDTSNVHPEIKSEPPEDINDTEETSVGDDTLLIPQEIHSPKIRLTPTNKLLATPTPVDPKRKFVCPYANCTKSYGKSSHLRSHLTWHTGIKPFVCQEPNCGKGFTRSDELNRHVRTHTGEKPFECIQCTKKFSRSDHLTKHLATHAKQMQNQPKRVRTPQKEQSTTKQEPKTRQTNPTPSPLDGMDTDDGFHFMAALTRDSSHLQHNSGEEAINPKEESAYKNDTANNYGVEGVHFMASFGGDVKTFKQEHYDNSETLKYDNDNEDERKHNISTTHNEHSDGIHFMTALGRDISRKYKQEAFEEEENLTNEPSIEHIPIKIKLERPENSDQYHVVPSIATQRSNPIVPHTVVIPASTILCSPLPEIKAEIKTECNDDDAIMPEANAPPLPMDESSFSMTQYVNSPAEIQYEQDRPFRCVRCIKRFKRQDDLNRHMRTHTGEKPFACGECNRRFMRRDHLKKHINTHTKLR